MAHPVGDAPAVEELARMYRYEANRVEELAVVAERRIRDTHWKGRRAARSEDEIRVTGRRAREAADQLRRMAGDLDAHAGWVRETIAELEDLERRIRWWASTKPPDPSTPGPDASWIHHWPGRHQFEWQDLARRLWSAGAWF